MANGSSNQHQQHWQTEQRRSCCGAQQGEHLFAPLRTRASTSLTHTLSRPRGTGSSPGHGTCLTCPSARSRAALARQTGRPSVKQFKLSEPQLLAALATQHKRGKGGCGQRLELQASTLHAGKGGWRARGQSARMTHTHTHTHTQHPWPHLGTPSKWTETPQRMPAAGASQPPPPRRPCS